VGKRIVLKNSKTSRARGDLPQNGFGGTDKEVKKELGVAKCNDVHTQRGRKQWHRTQKVCSETVRNGKS